MLTIQFNCPLENGLHARPASELEQRVAVFRSAILIRNLRNQRQADARSVLAMIGCDILFQDPCELVIDGEDEQAAHQTLSRFLLEEFAGCDEPAAMIVDDSGQPLPVFLSLTESALLRGEWR